MVRTAWIMVGVSCILPCSFSSCKFTMELFLNPFRTFSVLELILFFALVLPTSWAMLCGVPFVPTSMKQVRRMLKAAKLKPGMVIYDLGSGDGRLVHTAAREYGATAIGYEISPLVWIWSLFLSIFWVSNAKLRFGNFWKKDVRDADVIVCYLLPKVMHRMEKELLPQLKPGTLIISNAFSMKELKPIKVIERDRDRRLPKVLVYRYEGPKSKKVKVKKKSQTATKKT